jgi:hypothetical protein
VDFAPLSVDGGHACWQAFISSQAFLQASSIFAQFGESSHVVLQSTLFPVSSWNSSILACTGAAANSAANIANNIIFFMVFSSFWLRLHTTPPHNNLVKDNFSDVRGMVTYFFP